MPHAIQMQILVTNGIENLDNNPKLYVYQLETATKKTTRQAVFVTSLQAHLKVCLYMVRLKE